MVKALHIRDNLKEAVSWKRPHFVDLSIWSQIMLQSLVCWNKAIRHYERDCCVFFQSIHGIGNMEISTIGQNLYPLIISSYGSANFS